MAENRDEKHEYCDNTEEDEEFQSDVFQQPARLVTALLANCRAFVVDSSTLLTDVRIPVIM